MALAWEGSPRWEGDLFPMGSLASPESRWGAASSLLLGAHGDPQPVCVHVGVCREALGLSWVRDVAHRDQGRARALTLLS